MPTADALTEEQFETAGYGQFNGTPTRRELERFFFLDDADRRLVACAGPAGVEFRREP